MNSVPKSWGKPPKGEVAGSRKLADQTFPRRDDESVKAFEMRLNRNIREAVKDNREIAWRNLLTSKFTTLGAEKTWAATLSDFVISLNGVIDVTDERSEKDPLVTVKMANDSYLVARVDGTLLFDSNREERVRFVGKVAVDLKHRDWNRWSM